MHGAGGPVLCGLGAFFLGLYLLSLCVLVDPELVFVVLACCWLLCLGGCVFSSSCSLFNCCSLISGSKDPVFIFVIYSWNFK